jgi:hypothetical protein
VRVVRLLAEYYHKALDQLTEAELRQYFLYLKNEKRAARSSCTQVCCKPGPATWLTIPTFIISSPMAGCPLMGRLGTALARLFRSRQASVLSLSGQVSSSLATSRTVGASSGPDLAGVGRSLSAHRQRPSRPQVFAPTSFGSPSPITVSSSCKRPSYLPLSRQRHPSRENPHPSRRRVYPPLLTTRPAQRLSESSLLRLFSPGQRDRLAQARNLLGPASSTEMIATDNTQPKPHLRLDIPAFLCPTCGRPMHRTQTLLPQPCRSP